MVNFGWLESKFHNLFWFVFYIVIEISNKFFNTELVLGFTNNYFFTIQLDKK